jgi:hypothetical protein
MPPAEYSKFSLIELSVLAISDIIQELLKAHESGKDLNLNKIKTQISSKYGLPSTPKVCKKKKLCKYMWLFYSLLCSPVG